MSPSSAGLPFFSLAVAAGRNLRRTRCRNRGVLPCGLQAGQHGLDPRAASRAAGLFPGVDPHGSASGRRPTNFRLGFKRVPLQAWLASQRLPADGVPDEVRVLCVVTLGPRLHRPVRRGSSRKACLAGHRPCRCPLSRSRAEHGASWNSRVSAAVGDAHRCQCSCRPAVHGLAPVTASGTAHLVAEAVKPRAIRCNSPGFLAALQGLTGRPCRGFRPRSLLALAVPRRPLLEPQGVDRSHCGDSDCAEPLSLLGFLPSCPWPRPRWAACLAHSFTANTERVAASPLFASAGPRHLDRREAGLPRSGLSGRW